ncbi:hypothetical protein B0T25DRAFT_546180 [Lasiosphaeria hispida]|uniref:Uncharacterized protein n=1 Tax=Lasiosphaeria hispida TaxID=260671 RepID=A0AAJ0MBL1_9PEZI|nr:hypothetical protein B0T25DRAFT_546180 [Lasiosphaeria hispida]
MASNNALQVNEGLRGDYLTRMGVEDDEEFAKLVAELPTTLMDEVPHSTGVNLLQAWKLLGGEVRGLALYISEQAEHRSWDALSAKTREKLLEIAPTTATRFWADNYDGFILTTAWLWRIITDGFLCNPCRYDTPVWEAFGTLDAILSRRAGTLDGAIHPPPLPGKSNKNGERREAQHTNRLFGAINTAVGRHGNMEPHLLEYRYHQWRALTYSMLRHDEAGPHASPDRLARAIVEDVTAAFDFDEDFLDILKTSVAQLAAVAVRVDGYFLITSGNLMLTYRLPGRTEGAIIGRPFHQSKALISWASDGAQGDLIDMVVAPGIFSAGNQTATLTASWVGGWLFPIEVCVDFYKGMSAESAPATSPEGDRGESTAAPRTRKRVKAKAEKENRAKAKAIAKPKPKAATKGKKK